MVFTPMIDSVWFFYSGKVKKRRQREVLCIRRILNHGLSITVGYTVRKNDSVLIAMFNHVAVGSIICDTLSCRDVVYSTV